MADTVEEAVAVAEVWKSAGGVAPGALADVLADEHLAAVGLGEQGIAALQDLARVKAGQAQAGALQALRLRIQLLGNAALQGSGLRLQLDVVALKTGTHHITQSLHLPLNMLALGAYAQ